MEVKDLIYLVLYAVNGNTPDSKLVADINLDELYQLACRHMLAATIAPALKAAGIQDKRFSKALEHSALKSSTMDMEMDALFAELEAAGIWYMPLKGIVLQHYYPVYGMRQMSDHDILFDANRADDVKAIMERLGFSVDRFGVSNHDVYHKEPVSNFEMHRELFDSSHESYEYYKNVEERLLGDGCEKHFSPEDFYIYMTAHEYKHYYNSGTGLRSVLDTYMYLQKEKLDMDYVTAEAGKLGMTEFETANRSLALHLFPDGKLTEADKKMLEYILSSGVYGTFGNRVKNKMKKNGWSKLRYALNRFFVPISRKNRDYAAYARQYPFFYKYKILLPLLPFYRTFRALKEGKFQSEVRAIKNAKV